MSFTETWFITKANLSMCHTSVNQSVLDRSYHWKANLIIYVLYVSHSVSLRQDLSPRLTHPWLTYRFVSHPVFLCSFVHTDLRWLLIDWLIDWLIGWLIDWLVGWLIDWLVDWLVGGLIDWVVGWLIDWLIDWLTDWLIDCFKSRKP